MGRGGEAARRPIDPVTTTGTGGAARSRRAWIVRTIVAIVLGLGAVMLVLVVRHRGLPDPRTDQSLRHTLVRATTGRRLTTSRLVGGFEWAPSPGVTRSADGSPRRLDPALLIAAGSVEGRRRADDSPAALADRAVVRLLMGEPAEAASRLARAAQLAPGAAEHWSDLSAAYIEQGRVTPDRRLEFASRAADAAAIAITLNPSIVEAWFNRALAREMGRGLGDPLVAWREHIARERDRRWRSEAERHLAAVPTTSVVTRWEPLRRALVSGPAASDAVVEEAATLAGFSRELIEEALLPGWGRAWLDGRPAEASRALSTARRLARAVHARTGDPFLRDVLDAVDRSAGARRLELARGHVAYGDSRALFERARDLDSGAAALVARAHFEAGGSPFGLLTRIQSAILAYQTRTLAAAADECERIVADAHRRGYVVTEARGRILLGTVRMQQGRLLETVRLDRQALEMLRASAEPDIIANAQYSLVNVLRMLGDVRQGWAVLTDALERIDDVGNLRCRYLLFYNASLIAKSDRLDRAALLLQSAALEAAERRGVAGAITEAYTRRAALQAATGAADAAARDLAAARASLGRVSDATRTAYYTALLRATEGAVALDGDRAGARRALDDALGFFRVAEPADVPRLQLHRGRASLALGDPVQARADFESGIAQLERLTAHLDAGFERVSYFDEGWELFDEVVDASRHDPAVAFAYAERGRARALVDRLGLPPRRIETDPARVAAALDSRTALLLYVALPRRTLVWVLRRGEVGYQELPVDQTWTQRALDAWRAAVDDADDAAHERLARDLHERLVAPIRARLESVERLVIVANGAMPQLPFAAFRNPRTGRYLVEDFVVQTAPSANVFLAASARVAIPVPRPRALLVGDPAFDRARHAGLPALPGARDEVRRIRALYRGATMLIGADATKSHLLTAMESAEVVHIAAHALVNEEFPLNSSILLASGGEADDGELRVRDVLAATRARPAVVVLAGCGTGRGSAYRTEGVISIARAFLGLGSATVVASLWDVDDEASAELLAAFHRRLSAGIDAAMALTVAQRDMLHAPDPRRRLPRAWAAYLVAGAATILQPQVPGN